jgi:hypothetical protein
MRHNNSNSIIAHMVLAVFTHLAWLPTPMQAFELECTMLGLLDATAEVLQIARVFCMQVKHVLNILADIPLHISQLV